MWESVREWAHTLSSGLPLWKLESLWSLEFSKSNLKGQNSLDWIFLFTIEKILRCRCLKWAHMIHLNTYNTIYGWKKWQKSKYQFDSWPLKVGNCIELHACKWCATYHWKALEEGYKSALNFTWIEGFHKKLWASKMVRVLISKKLGFPTWESQEKWHVRATPMVSHKKYYKGEVDGFPQIKVVVNLVNLCMFTAHLCI
jgi:hypothetical protein